MNVKPLLKLMVEKKASDLFFAPFAPAKIKIEGKIMPVNKLEMSPKMVKQAALELMTEEQMDEFTKEYSTSAATSRWCCAILPRTCRRLTNSACRSSSRSW